MTHRKLFKQVVIQLQQQNLWQKLYPIKFPLFPPCEMFVSFCVQLSIQYNTCEYMIQSVCN